MTTFVAVTRALVNATKKHKVASACVLMDLKVAICIVCVLVNFIWLIYIHMIICLLLKGDKCQTNTTADEILRLAGNL